MLLIFGPVNPPFVYGKIAFGKYFASRNDDIRRLSGNFKNKVNTAIVAPRRAGKSSLVYKASEEFSHYSYYRICFVDLFRVRSEDEFYRAIANACIQSLASSEAERIELARKFLSGVAPQLSLGPTPENELNVEFGFGNKISEEVIHLGNEIAKRKSLTLLMCIDNFQVLENFSGSGLFLQKLRSAWDTHTNVIYCFIGSNRHFLIPLFSDPEQPLYKFCDLMLLDKPKQEDLASYISERFRDTGKTITTDYARKISELMECHPLYTQQLAHIVWEHTQTRVEDGILDASVQELISRNLILFQRQFDGLSNIQVNVLRAISEGIKEGFTSKDIIHKYALNSSATCLRALAGLEAKDVIQRHATRIEFSDPAFKLWLKQVWN